MFEHYSLWNTKRFLLFFALIYTILLFQRANLLHYWCPVPVFIPQISIPNTSIEYCWTLHLWTKLVQQNYKHTKLPLHQVHRMHRITHCCNCCMNEVKYTSRKYVAQLAASTVQWWWWWWCKQRRNLTNEKCHPAKYS
jgi:hypothetical protein